MEEVPVRGHLYMGRWREGEISPMNQKCPISLPRPPRKTLKITLPGTVVPLKI